MPIGRPKISSRGPRQRAWALVFLCGLGVGLCVAQIPFANATDIGLTYQKLRVFSQVLAYVQDSYVDELEEDELVYGAIRGMLRDLDPHTAFMRPAEYQKLKEDTAGEFGGLGIELRQLPEEIRITRVHAGGPAANAGLESADRILAVDGEDTTAMELPELIKLLRGVPGTTVTLRIARRSWQRSRDIPLVRQQVRIPSVHAKALSEDIQYIQITSFQERTDLELGQALQALHQQHDAKRGEPWRGLILDLRDNPGGLFEEGVKVADRFLRDGLIVRTEGRDPRNVERDDAHLAGTEPEYPLVVLINGGSASASEIVAGALQDQRRAVVVGTRSYGKGSVQTLYGLEDGAGLKLTIARYYTPSGRSIQDTGIEPDVFQAPGTETQVTAPAGKMDGTGPAAALDRDPQLKSAIDVVSRWPADLPARNARK